MARQRPLAGSLKAERTHEERKQTVKEKREEEKKRRREEEKKRRREEGGSVVSSPLTCSAFRGKEHFSFGELPGHLMPTVASLAEALRQSAELAELEANEASQSSQAKDHHTCVSHNACR